MTETIDKATFDHLVDLAAFELEEEEAEYLRRELNKQLDSIREMEAIPLDEDIELTMHGVTYTPGLSADIRSDERRPSDKADSIIKQAPQSEERYFVVPEIPHTDLE